MPLNAEYAIDGVNGEEAICGGLITKVSAKKMSLTSRPIFLFGARRGRCEVDEGTWWIGAEGLTGD